MPSIGELTLDVKAKTDGFVSKMKGVASSAGKAQMAVAGIAAAAAAAGAAIAALGAAALDTVKDIAATGDAAAKASAQVGLTAEAYQELGHAMELSGEDIDVLRKGLLRLSRNMNDVTEGVKAPREAFETLGITVTDQAGNLRDMESILPELADTFAGMADGPQKAAIAMEIFGKSGAQMIPFLNAGSKGIAEMREEARELGIVMSNEAAATSERFNDTLDRLDKAFQGVKTTIGVALLPAFTEMFNIILTVTKSILQSVPVADYMKQALGGLTQGAIYLIETLDKIAPVISVMGTAIGVASNLGQIWLSGFFAIGKVIAGVSAKIMEFVTGALSGLIGAGAEVAESLGYDGLAGALKTAEKGIGDVARAAGGVGDVAFDSLGDTVASVAEDIGDIDGLLSNLATGETTSALRETLGKIKEGLENIGSASLDAAKDFEGAAVSMANSAKKVVESLSEIETIGPNTSTLANMQRRLKGNMAEARDNSAIQKAATERKRAAIGQAQGAASVNQAGTGAVTAGLTEVATMLTGGLIPAFTDLWKSSESFSQALGIVSNLLNTALGPVVEGIGQNLLVILEPIVGLFEALAPALSAIMAVMNPFILPLKVVAALFNALAKPINSFIRGIKRAFVALINIGRKSKNKAYVTDDGTIIDPKGKYGDQRVVINDDSLRSNQQVERDREAAEEEASRRAAEAADKLAKAMTGLAGDLVAAGNAFTGVFEDALYTFGMGSGTSRVWNDLSRNMGLATVGVGNLAESAREASESLSNVPQIFRANLRRGQAGMGGGPSGGGPSGGGIYIAGNVVVQGADIDATMASLRRRNFTAYGESYTGIAAASALPAAG